MLANDVPTARHNMVEQQVRPWNVFDSKVLNLLENMPREAFVPEAYRGLAYADIEIPLGDGQHMMFPRLEGHMLQALQIKPSDKILEIGTGSGFVTACLARLGVSVVTIDSRAELLELAQEHLADQGINNVRFLDGNAFETDLGSRYDVIAVTGSLPHYNGEFQELLAPDGRLFVVSGEAPVMETLLVTRVGDQFRTESLFETELSPLDGAPQREKFSF